MNIKIRIRIKIKIENSSLVKGRETRDERRETREGEGEVKGEIENKTSRVRVSSV